MKKINKENDKVQKPYSKLIRLFVILTIVLCISWTGLYAANYVIDEYSSRLSGGIEDIVTPKKTEISALVCGINEYLTDTIIYVKANVETGKISYISIPRDTYVTNSYAFGNKINSIYRKIDMEPLIDQVETMLDVSIDYYIVVDADVVIDLVDAIGGVEFDVPIRMDYYDPTQDLRIDLQPGLQLLDGDKAEQVIRFRKNSDGTGYLMGDIDRVKVQQDFIKALIQTLAKPENVLKANDIISAVISSTDTNVTLREALKYVSDIPNMDLENIYSTTAAGTTPYIDGISYFKMDIEETREIIKENF